MRDMEVYIRHGSIYNVLENTIIAIESIVISQQTLAKHTIIDLGSNR